MAGTSVPISRSGKCRGEEGTVNMDEWGTMGGSRQRTQTVENEGGVDLSVDEI